MNSQPVYILAIESSCDDTAIAILKNDQLLANVVSTQNVHEKWGGVVPELASRAHLQNILPTLEIALQQAKIDKHQLNAIAYTRGPGLLGSLLVGGTFAKAYATALGIPIIEVNHLQAHIIAHFIENGNEKPNFPFLCLTVSGGHTQIVKVQSHLKLSILGETNDDAAGEAFDKAAKILGLPYPGGPMVDEWAKNGNPQKFTFPEPKANQYDFSFSGLKTSFLYLVNREKNKDPLFIEHNKADLCASLQHSIVQTLLKKLVLAAINEQITDIALAGGVSANSLLRKRFGELQKEGFKTFIPPFEYCTDNAAMIGIVGFFKYQEGLFSNMSAPSLARFPLGDLS
jgi:N6-L-threonylcarbamoyladenine synthase